MEVYAVGASEGEVVEALAFWSGLSPRALEGYLQVYRERAAAEHLFRVALGLESLVLGEPQILGQVSRAHRRGLEAGTVGRELDRLFRAAVETARRLRQETGLDQGALSISHVAVQLVKERLGGLEGKTVVVVGTGKMGQTAARLLAAEGAEEILLVYRTWTHARTLAAELRAWTYPLEALPGALRLADAVLSATSSPTPLITFGLLAEVMADRSDRPLLLVDIAVPRDVEPEVADLPGVTVANVDDLQQVVQANLEARRRAADRAQARLPEALERYWRARAAARVAPALGALDRRAEALKAEALAELRRRLPDLTPRQEEVIQQVLHRTLRRLLHPAKAGLRARAAVDPEEALAAFRALFGELIPAEGQGALEEVR